VLLEALALFPEYHYALDSLAKVRTAQNKHEDAADLRRRHYAAAPHPENLFALATALERAGRTSDARVAYAEFERQAVEESMSRDNANRELVFYYVDHAGKADQALRIAEMEIARRQDVYTLDAYAWALHANNRPREAGEHVERALAVGVKDPEILSRAAIIQGRAAAAARP
jgi:Flp pilus assembly protein TadD